MLDFIFEEKYKTAMEDLKGKISERTYNDLESFFINTNLDYKQRENLIKIISRISDESNSKAKGTRPKSWEF